jgi:hypothetical protein
MRETVHAVIPDADGVKASFKVTREFRKKINRFPFNSKLDRIDWMNARLRGIAHHPHAKGAASLCETGARTSVADTRKPPSDKARKEIFGSLEQLRFD